MDTTKERAHRGLVRLLKEVDASRGALPGGPVEASSLDGDDEKSTLKKITIVSSSAIGLVAIVLILFALKRRRDAKREKEQRKWLRWADKLRPSEKMPRMQPAESENILKVLTLAVLKPTLAAVGVQLVKKLTGLSKQ
ncbi:MAG: hypothetical protein ACFCU3_03365 [Verrucomicrobiales bacterium]